MDYKKLYHENPDFKRYVDESMRVRYRDRTLQEVLALKLVQEVGMYYLDGSPAKKVLSEYQRMGECV